MKEAVAIRHVGFEDLGTFEPVLTARGLTIRYAEAAIGLDRVDPLAPSLLVVLGGPIGVYEHEAYPFLTQELQLLKRRIAAGLPTLGVCLGCQLLAAALGARVYPGRAKEIGWSPLTLTEVGMASPLRPLAAPGVQVLHWHGDTFDLPDGARLLASTALYPNQAFAHGPADLTLGLQFHAEVTATGLEHWFIGHACEIATTDSVNVQDLRADTHRFATSAAVAGAAMLTSWLDRVGV
ncbi:MAG: glutamine amidotransferase [Rhodospirillales bacterium]|nr:glutamine amidotransferase [Rhodospirillales bacterium]